MKITDIVEFNPTTSLIKGEIFPFIEMAVLPISGRKIPTYDYRIAKGSGSKFKNGDTLFARITPCLENGKGGMVMDLPNHGKGHGSTEFVVMRAHRKTDQNFVYYLSRLPEFRAFAVQQMSGTSGRQRVSWQSLANFEITDIPSKFRESIGSFLGMLDDKIELNRQMNETLQAMAWAIFKDWFIDFGPTRAKAEGRAPYLSPDLWDLFPSTLDNDGKPSGWERGTLADIAESSRRSINPADVSGDTPYIGLEHMPRKSIALSNWENAAKISSNKTQFNKGDILFGKLRPYFHKVGVAPLTGICSTDIVVAVPRSEHWAAFTLACLSSGEFVDYASRTSTGTRMPRTSWKTMAQYEICLPSKQIALAFQDLVQSILDKINSNIHNTSSLDETRDLLLPRLMSGQIQLQSSKR